MHSIIVVLIEDPFMDTKAVLETIIPLARDAGQILMDYYRRPLNAQTKTSSVDLVTEADQSSEKLIVAVLKEAYPDHHIVGEEGGGMGASAESAEYFWYIDPLDGTSNFNSRIPHFCVSIALTDANRQPLAAAVYAPYVDELFSAAKGHGAWLNDTPMQVSANARLNQCILASGFAYDRATNPDNNAREWSAFIPRVRGLRRMGAAALDACYVAAGRYDGYWERSLSPWDVLGGVLCVLEAGGKVTDYTGGPDPYHDADGRFVVSNGLIHQQMLDTIASVREKAL